MPPNIPPKPDAMAAGLLARFDAIGSRASEISVAAENAGMIGSAKYSHSMIALVKSYQQSQIQFGNLTSNLVLLEYIGIPNETLLQTYKITALADALIVNCNAAIGYLQSVISAVPKEIKDKLDSLKERIATIEQSNANLFRHLHKAIEEQEAGHYLGGTLVAAKVIDFLLDKLQGSTDEEKVNNLVRQGVLEERLKDGFLRGLRRSRNFYSHDISLVPESEEALGVLSTACDLALKYSQMNE